MTSSVKLPSNSGTMPNIWPRLFSKSTLTNCRRDLMSTPNSDRAIARVPEIAPSKACNSPTATSRRPIRMVVAIAVRPSSALLN